MCSVLGGHVKVEIPEVPFVHCLQNTRHNKKKPWQSCSKTTILTKQVQRPVMRQFFGIHVFILLKAGTLCRVGRIGIIPQLESTFGQILDAHCATSTACNYGFILGMCQTQPKHSETVSKVVECE